MCSAIVKVDKRPYRKIAQEHWGLTNKQMKGMHVHHCIPQSEGGPNDPSNLYVCSPWFHAHVWHDRAFWIETQAKACVAGGRANKGVKRTPQAVENLRKGALRRYSRPEERRLAGVRALGNKSLTGKKNPHVPVTCPHCSKSGRPGPMARHHFNNCKHKS